MKDAHLDQYVESRTESGITTIEFFHHQSNSLPGALLTRLAATIREAGKNPDCTVIVLKSGGHKAFCAGASFDELIQIKTEAEGLVFFSGFAHVINAIRTIPQLVIARIQGKCVGGGVGLAAAVDYAIAVAQADIKLSELAVGIGPFVVGPAVERKMGTAAFTALAIDASSWRTASWAQAHGLFSELYETIEQTDAAVDRLAKTLAQSSPDAMSALKTVFWQGTEHWDNLLKERAGISGRLILSDYSRQAIDRFKAKSK